MLFCHQSGGVLAISQPAHAWISGQLLRAWEEPLDEPLLLAAEQHDIAWMEWEVAPSFDPATGRPHLFRHVGAALHAPLWARGVERAYHAWGAHVALLISRHGSTIYARYTDRHQLSAADGEAVDRFNATQSQRQAAWTRQLDLGRALLDRHSALVAFADTLSLALCGELRTPLALEAPGTDGRMRELSLVANPGAPAEFRLSPWPFRTRALTVSADAMPMPAGGRFTDEAAMRDWLASGARTRLEIRLIAGD